MVYRKQALLAVFSPALFVLPSLAGACHLAQGTYCSPCTSDVCSDGVDNDCDGKTDCADPDCCGKTGPNGMTCCNSDSCCSGGYKCDLSRNTCYTSCSSNPECADSYCCTAASAGGPGGSSCVSAGYISGQYLCDPPDWGSKGEKKFSLFEAIFS